MKEEFAAAHSRGHMLEIVVDLGPTGLLGGGSIGDVREALREEVARVLREEGKEDLLEQVQEDLHENQDKPPLVSVEEALVREGGEAARQRALRREEDGVTGMSGKE